MLAEEENESVSSNSTGVDGNCVTATPENLAQAEVRPIEEAQEGKGNTVTPKEWEKFTLILLEIDVKC